MNWLDKFLKKKETVIKETQVEVDKVPESMVGKRYRLEFLMCGHVLKTEGVITEDNQEEGWFKFRIVDETCHSDTKIDSPQLIAWLSPMKIYYSSVLKSARIFENTDW